jgi:Gram-negative bacterial TonB protein C-terminal
MRMMFASIVMVACASVALAQSGRAGPPDSFAELAYPTEALEKRVQGTVILAVKIDASGKVIDAELLAGPALLAAPAAANAKLWTLTPGARSDALIYRFEIEHALCADDTRSLFRRRRHNLALVTRVRRAGGVELRNRSATGMSSRCRSVGRLPTPKSRSVPVGTAPSSWMWPSTPRATSSRRRR